MRPLWVGLCALVALTGCVDTELGLDATVDSARIRVVMDAGADVVTARLETTYRVGEFAEGDRRFQPQAIELYVDGELVARMIPRVPPTFVQTVSPGQSFMSPIDGEDGMPVNPRALCGASVVVLLRWLDASTDEIGVAEATVTDVTCE